MRFQVLWSGNLFFSTQIAHLVLQTGIPRAGTIPEKLLEFKIFFQHPWKLLENSLFSFGNFKIVWEECCIRCGGGRKLHFTVKCSCSGPWNLIFIFVPGKRLKLYLSLYKPYKMISNLPAEWTLTLQTLIRSCEDNLYKWPLFRILFWIIRSFETQRNQTPFDFLTNFIHRKCWRKALSSMLQIAPNRIL